MSSSPIKDALAALARNADHVEAAALGGTLERDSLPKAAQAALQQASALRAAGEDAWRLHPRLREYLQDHLQHFGAYPSPSGIGERINALRDFRVEALTAHAERDHESLRALLGQITVTVWDIADQTERNLKFLGSMLSIKYGAVQTMKAKLGPSACEALPELSRPGGVHPLQRQGAGVHARAATHGGHGRQPHADHAYGHRPGAPAADAFGRCRA